MNVNWNATTQYTENVCSPNLLGKYKFPIYNYYGLNVPPAQIYMSKP